MQLVHRATTAPRSVEPVETASLSLTSNSSGVMSETSRYCGAVRDLGIGTMIWSPLAGGFLSGKYTREGGEGRRAGFSFPPVELEQGYRIVDELKTNSAAHDASVAQVALAWVRMQDGVTTTIIGASKEHQLVANLASVKIALSPQELARLDEVSAIAPSYPQWLPSMKRGEDMFGRFASLTEEEPAS